ncbi:hypothetical protein [Streptomyces cacaoi]|uniref:hypothetical protein n=1 Tax=Streptomyces cacaoi TaxID=1898 RepID=UPI003749E561
MAYAEKRISTARGSKGKVTWRARYKKPDGTWGSEPGFPTKKTAERWGEEQEAATRAGRWVDPGKSACLLADFVPVWMKAQGDAPRGRTIMNRWERLETHVLPQWGNTPLNAFTWFEVESWARVLGKTVAHSTVKDVVGLLTRVLNGAVDARHLTANPLAGRRLTGMPADPAAKAHASSGDGTVIAVPEEVLLLGRRLGPVVGLQVITDAWTGLRYEELVGLHRENMLRQRRQKHDGGFFECPVIRIDKEVGALAEYYVRDEDGKRRCYRAFEPPKNEQSARDVDLPPFLAGFWTDFLTWWPFEYVATTPKGALWWRSHWCKTLRPAADGRPARPKARGTAVKVAWEPIKPGLTAQALRKTHDSWQEELGVAPVLAHEQMGHKYPGIKGVYRQPTPAMRKYRLEALQTLFERAMANLGWETVWQS